MVSAVPHPPQLLFPTADFSELAVGQKWDRVRLTCSQPFNPCSRFGLSFIRLRTPQEQEPDPPGPLLDTVSVSHTSMYLSLSMGRQQEGAAPLQTPLVSHGKPGRYMLG